MERELDCGIVRDLLPLYVDGMVSDISKKSIENHLEHCSGCKEMYNNMASNLEIGAQPPEVGDVKRFLKKTKKMYLLYGLCTLSFIAIFVCIIVDLALNKGITWSLITGVSCLFADVFIYAISTCRKNRGCVAMTVISIGTFCLLSAIQITGYYLMGNGTFWIMRYGLPILLLWLAIVWIPVLTRTFLEWNIWDCIALFLLFVIIGNYVTKLITGDYAWNDILHMREFAANGLGEVAGIIIFVIIGRVKNMANHSFQRG